ncbi:MAG TPA: acyl-CoA dehydrogenase family protein, partial [Spirochaetota bacterium]|nr:acyl-CoA dehydrogenase family protein [Spirochaetota bacterium]HPP96359.1 acyl-CoA dehydrogenase family protein [Spirochaetota bacterium]
FQAVGFKVADSAMMMDAMRSVAWSTALAIDSGKASAGKIRRMVSQAKKFITEGAWQVANNCMQVMGGIGYTNVFPIERIVRDIRLSMIWVGTNEIMQHIIQTEWYKEHEKNMKEQKTREVELDAKAAFETEEKVYE